jgi:hypothetical protein
MGNLRWAREGCGKTLRLATSDRWPKGRHFRQNGGSTSTFRGLTLRAIDEALFSDKPSFDVRTKDRGRTGDGSSASMRKNFTP